MSARSDFFVALEDATPVEVVGHKAFNLGRLTRLGQRVPGGVVLLTSLLDAHLKSCGLTEDVQRLANELSHIAPDEIAAKSQIIRDKIIVTALHRELDTALDNVFQSFGPRAILAVRSSAVGEDSSAASFAGQLDSCLNVQTFSQLTLAVRTTWASLWSTRCLHYQKHHALALDAMGVILQRQVNAQWSGVLFSRSPLRGTGQQHKGQEHKMLLECCLGLGDALVSGKVDPVQLVADRSRCDFDGDHTAEPLASHSSALEELLRASLALEGEFGAALDIEWSIDQAGLLHFLQARPITTDARPASETTLWSNANIAENFPDPVSPLLYSIAARGYSAYFRNLGIAFGLSKRRIQAMVPALEHIIGAHGARLYYNLTNIHRVLYIAPGGRWLAKFFNDFTGASGTIEDNALPARNLLERMAEALRVPVKIAWQYIFVQQRVREFEKTVDQFCAATRPEEIAHWPLTRLHGAFRGFMDIRENRWNNAALADTAAMVSYGLLKLLLRSALPNQDTTALHNTLLKGLPDVASNIPVLKLWELSRTVRGNADLLRLFERHTPGEICALLPDHAAFHAQVTAYLEQWGFRGSRELMLTVAGPQENPLEAMQLLKVYAERDGESPQAMLARQAGEREQMTITVLDLVKSIRWRNRFPFLGAAARLRMVLRATQGAIKLRERARFKQARLYTRLRRIILAIGQRLVEAGTISTVEDVFFLTCEELERLLGGTEMFAYSVDEMIARRRIWHAGLAAMAVPDSMTLAVGAYLRQETSLDTSPTATSLDTPTNAFSGASACGGCAEGSAAVLADASESAQFKGHSILVTRQTDPGWAALLFLVQGLVIERGGMLSHGAIIAREYGIPAVIGVKNATQLIRTGDRVRVDGDRGVVEIIHA